MKPCHEREVLILQSKIKIVLMNPFRGKANTRPCDAFRTTGLGKIPAIYADSRHR